jgi:hypothetical protein
MLVWDVESDGEGMYMNCIWFCNGSSTCFYRAWRHLTLGEQSITELFVLLTCIYFSNLTSLDLTTLHGLLPILNTNIPQHYLSPS